MTHFNKVGLVLLVSRGHQPVYLSAQTDLRSKLSCNYDQSCTQAYLLVIIVRNVPLRKTRLSLPIL